MLLRAVPVTAEIHKESDVLILTVWLCWDDDKTFQNIIKCEHENGNITLDSYDTFKLKRSDDRGFHKDCVNIHLETNKDNTWQPTEHQNNIVAAQVWGAHKAKCSFRLHNCTRNHHEGQLYITLRIFQNAKGSQSEIKFILRKRAADLQMIQQQKDVLLDVLDTLSSVDATHITGGSNGSGDSCLTCMAIPYVDCMLHLTDDIIVTLWLCRCDQKRHDIEALKKEQKIYSRLLLDTENSFVILNMDEPVISHVLLNNHYTTISETQSVEPGRVSHGMRAKFQFISRRVESCSEYVSKTKKSPQRKYVKHAELKKELNSEEIREDKDELLSTKQNNKLDVELITKQKNGMQIEFKTLKELSCFILGKERDNPFSPHSWKENVLRGVFRRTNYKECNFRLNVRWGYSQIKKTHAFIFILVLAFLSLYYISDFYSQRHTDDMASNCTNLVLPTKVTSAAIDECTVKVTGSFIIRSPRSRKKTSFKPSNTNITITTNVPRNAGYELTDFAAICIPITLVIIGVVLMLKKGVNAASGGPKQITNVCVVRIHLLLSYNEDSDDTLALKVLFNKVNSTNYKHDLLLNELRGWTVADSSDTFLLQIPLESVNEVVVSAVKATFTAHHSSYWTPIELEKTIAVEEITEGEIVQRDCRLRRNHSKSENGRVNVTVRVTQKHVDREVQFIVRKEVGEIKRLMKQKRYMNVGSILASSFPSSPKKVMHDEYQICLAVPFVDCMHTINDDIILTVWMCSIQESTKEFDALKREQKHFSRIQLDTENSFVFSNMQKSITAMVSVSEGSLEVVDPIKKIEPIQIKDAQRAKLQFVCKCVNATDSFEMLDLRITILQTGEPNEVQFMARKKVELFLE